MVKNLKSAAWKCSSQAKIGADGMDGSASQLVRGLTTITDVLI